MPATVAVLGSQPRHASRENATDAHLGARKSPLRTIVQPSKPRLNPPSPNATLTAMSGGIGAQPITSSLLRQLTHAGAQVRPGTHTQPNCAVGIQRP